MIRLDEEEFENHLEYARIPEMLLNKNFLYVPALRFKQGEYRALKSLAPDVASRITPRLVFPPPSEHDPEKKRRLSQDEIIHLNGRRLGLYWPMRTALLDPGFLFAAFGDDAGWLKNIFRAAREANGFPIPVATIEDILGGRGSAFRDILREEDGLQIALKISFGEINKNLADRIRSALNFLGGLEPSACLMLLDFSDADMSDVDAVAPILEAAVEHIHSIAVWHGIVFQGTNYPEKNPAAENSMVTVPRNEWLAWLKVIHNNPSIAQLFQFGDYCSDSSKFVFKSGRATPIKHLRYCTTDSWLVARAETDASYKDAMRSVSQSIITNSKLDGQDFSDADEHIFGIANGFYGPGNASTWREINIGRHLTKVVSDLGTRYGFSIARRKALSYAQQPNFLSDE